MLINVEIINTYEEAMRMERSKTVTKEETRMRYTQLANDCEDVLDIRDLNRFERRRFEKIYNERRKNW